MLPPTVPTLRVAKEPTIAAASGKRRESVADQRVRGEVVVGRERAQPAGRRRRVGGSRAGRRRGRSPRGARASSTCPGVCRRRGRCRRPRCGRRAASASKTPLEVVGCEKVAPPLEVTGATPRGVRASSRAPRSRSSLPFVRPARARPDAVRGRRQLPDARARCVGDRVRDRARGRDAGRLADALGALRARVGRRDADRDAPVMSGCRPPSAACSRGGTGSGPGRRRRSGRLRTAPARCP